MIQIFKFGGASIKDAAGFRNVCSILEAYKGQPLVLIVSALGKTTNALEAVAASYVNRTGEAAALLRQIKQHHEQIMLELFQDTASRVFDEVNNAFVEIDWLLEDEPHESYDYLYDQIVSIGEMAATKILAACLNERQLPTQWVDVRDCIRTDNTYREGRVDWVVSQQQIRKVIPPLLKDQFVITQGFLGGTSENITTTLGREGSDYSAAIFAYALDASQVTIWKDVPGVLNADPRFFSDTKKIDRLSYREAIEMTYYGASVIHPKTMKPLQNKSIPLHVRCFNAPQSEGTLISAESDNSYPAVLVLKKDQVLLSIYPRDFSFIAEDNLSHIFSQLSASQIKVNLMQNSALSFSICIDHSGRIDNLLQILRQSFSVFTNEHLELLTIRHYAQAEIVQYTKGKKILLEQKSRHTIQLVLQPDK